MSVLPDQTLALDVENGSVLEAVKSRNGVVDVGLPLTSIDHITSPQNSGVPPGEETEA